MYERKLFVEEYIKDGWKEVSLLEVALPELSLQE